MRPKASIEQSIAFDIVGAGPKALLLPALSSIATRQEMRPLADRLGAHMQCVMPDWPGFGTELPAGVRLGAGVLDAFLDGLLDRFGPDPITPVAAGHGSAFVMNAARRHPGRFARVVLVAPTWRGPLPTMLGDHRRGFCDRVKAAIEAPLLGHALFRLNLSRPVVRWMMREHVYADPARVTPALLDDKMAVAHRPDRRFGTAAFVTGGLDAVRSREAFLALFEGDLPPVLVLRPRHAPTRSGQEMDALVASGLVQHADVAGALAPHEEAPEAVAQAIMSHLRLAPSTGRPASQ